MRLPAVCTSCGEIFPSSYSVENSSNISFSGCMSGPCPACGGQGQVPDGVYNFFGNTIELLSGPAGTVKELQRLATILKKAKENNLSFNEIAKDIEQQVPELSSIKDVLPKTRTELYAFIAIIISTIALLISQSSSDEPKNIEINNVINNVYQQAPVTNNNTQKPLLKKKKTGRNEPCPCGSGIKYKKCCLYKM